LPQHFLYFLPLPHGQGSLRPTFFSATCGVGQFNSVSKSVMSSGLSGANSILYVQPFSSKVAATSFIRFSVCTLTTAGFFSVPSFAAFFPSKIFSIFPPSRILQHSSAVQRARKISVSEIFHSGPSCRFPITDCLPYFRQDIYFCPKGTTTGNQNPDYSQTTQNAQASLDMFLFLSGESAAHKCRADRKRSTVKSNVL
jgi:hypothetical protein